MEHTHHRANLMSCAASSFILDVIDISSSSGSHLLFYAKTSRLITNDDSIGS